MNNSQSVFAIRCIAVLLIMLSISACTKQDDSPTPGPTGPCSNPDEFIFEEKDGLLVIEAENATIPTDWVTANSVAEFTGTGYIQWEGANNFGKTGEGLINYKIRIATPGTYRFQWRSRINEGTNATESNDAWVKFPDAADFFGRKSDGSSTVYPKGSGKTPNPNGGGGDGWFKVYMNQAEQWSVQARTSDNDAHDLYVTFSTAGDYTLQVSGRSKGFAIDRIVLYLDSVNNATDATQSESNIVCQ
ncbi:MAG TPA: hypothetical protein DCS93_28545 [Microscillaceae bacterium]|nr:hypothetical protein [Microscillaceae bacterium]